MGYSRIAYGLFTNRLLLIPEVIHESLMGYSRIEQVVAACITCAALALAHGGFEMLDLVAACSVARQPDESLEVRDVTLELTGKTRDARERRGWGEALEACPTLYLSSPIW